MKKILLLALLLNCTLFTAQIKFEKGYLITHDGKKIECFIKNIDWNNNPDKFKFKRTAQSEIETGSLETIKEFGVYNFSKYKRFKVGVDKSSTNINRLSNQRNPELNIEIHFLKVLIEGDINLYQLTKNNKILYFINSKEIEIVQLIHKEYILPNESQVRKNNTYKNQLYKALSDANLKKSAFKNLKYFKKDLIKLFTKYHKITTKKFDDFESKPQRTSYRLNLLTGVNHSSFSAKNTQSKNELNFASKYNMFVGVENEFVLPYHKDKWSVLLEPSFQSFSSTATSKGSEKQIDYKRIDIALGIRHSFFLNPTSKIYLNLHYVYGIDLSSKIRIGEQELYDINGTGNIATGIGYQYKKLHLSIRHDFKRDLLSDYAFWNNSFSKTGFYIGYQLL